MTISLIIGASMVCAYLAGPLSQRRPLMFTDLACAAIGVLVGLSMSEFLFIESASNRLSLPLLFACGLTASIIALRQRSLPNR